MCLTAAATLVLQATNLFNMPVSGSSANVPALSNGLGRAVLRPVLTVDVMACKVLRLSDGNLVGVMKYDQLKLHHWLNSMELSNLPKLTMCILPVNAAKGPSKQDDRYPSIVQKGWFLTRAPSTPQWAQQQTKKHWLAQGMRHKLCEHGGLKHQALAGCFAATTTRYRKNH